MRHIVGRTADRFIDPIRRGLIFKAMLGLLAHICYLHQIVRVMITSVWLSLRPAIGTAVPGPHVTMAAARTCMRRPHVTINKKHAPVAATQLHIFRNSFTDDPAEPLRLRAFEIFEGCSRSIFELREPC